MSVKHRILQQALVLRLHFREMHVVYQCLAAGINAYSVLFMYGGKGRGSKGRRRRRKEEEDEDGKTRPDIFLYSLYCDSPRCTNPILHKTQNFCTFCSLG